MKSLNPVFIAAVSVSLLPLFAPKEHKVQIPDIPPGPTVPVYDLLLRGQDAGINPRTDFLIVAKKDTLQTGSVKTLPPLPDNITEEQKFRFYAQRIKTPSNNHPVYLLFENYKSPHHHTFEEGYKESVIAAFEEHYAEKPAELYILDINDHPELFEANPENHKTTPFVIGFNKGAAITRLRISTYNESGGQISVQDWFKKYFQQLEVTLPKLPDDGPQFRQI